MNTHTHRHTNGLSTAADALTLSARPLLSSITARNTRTSTLCQPTQRCSCCQEASMGALAHHLTNTANLACQQRPTSSQPLPSCKLPPTFWHIMASATPYNIRHSHGAFSLVIHMFQHIPSPSYGAHMPLAHLLATHFHRKPANRGRENACRG